MKNIKDITISIFAVIGFVAIITGFTNQSEQTNPESHVWELTITNDSSNALAINKKTGEVRKYRMNRVIDKNANEYIVMKEKQQFFLAVGKQIMYVKKGVLEQSNGVKESWLIKFKYKERKFRYI